MLTYQWQHHLDISWILVAHIYLKYDAALNLKDAVTPCTGDNIHPIPNFFELVYQNKHSNKNVLENMS